MSNDSTIDKRHWRVGRFSEKTRPAKYAGTWYWDVGWIMGQEIGFPIFHIHKSSHGYRKGTFRKKTGPFSRKGPIIKTKTEALRQAKSEMAKLKFK